MEVTSPQQPHDLLLRDWDHWNLFQKGGGGSGKSWLELRVPVAEEGGKRGRGGGGCHAPSGLSQSLLGAKESAGLE